MSQQDRRVMLRQRLQELGIKGVLPGAQLCPEELEKLGVRLEKSGYWQVAARKKQVRRAASKPLQMEGSKTIPVDQPVAGKAARLIVDNPGNEFGGLAFGSGPTGERRRNARPADR